MATKENAESLEKDVELHSSQLQEALQKLDFSTPDSLKTYEVVGEHVLITPSPGNHTSGSSNMTIQSIVDFSWQERFYTGQLLAVHKDGVFLAYGIKANITPGGAIRVVNRKTEQRILIKGLEGNVQDIAFAYIPQRIILACMDSKENVFIYEVEDNQLLRQLNCHMLLHIQPDELSQERDFSRVTWCPFIPEDTEDDDMQDRDDMYHEYLAWLLALTRGNKVEVWNVKEIMMSKGVGPVKTGDADKDCLEIVEHNKPIVSASFSPDGTAIATASLDGDVKFFQVFAKNLKRRRHLHHWQPHEGEPLSCLFFLDNHKNYNPEVQFWKYAITGAKNNTELKVWSCQTWSCLQTLAFNETSDKPVKLNASLDLSSGFLLLSNFHKKIFYVFQLFIDNNESTAAIISVSEFLLPYPILSFGIVDAGLVRFKSNKLQELADDQNDKKSILGVLICMYIVQPKSLQDCKITFIPPQPNSFDKDLLLPIQESPLIKHILPIQNNHVDESLPSLHKQELQSNHNSCQRLNLMTPDAFNSPVKHDTPGSTTLLKNHIDEISYSNSTTLVASPHSPDEEADGLLQNDVKLANVFGFTSGGSSPSREVQEILSEGKCFYQENDEIRPDDHDIIDLTRNEEQPPNSSVWPEIPMLKMPDVRKNEELSHKSVNHVDTRGVADADMCKMYQRLETAISSMIKVMNSLMQANEEQASELKQLRAEMKQQHLVREIDQSVTRNIQQQIRGLEDFIESRNKIQESAVCQTVTNFLSTKLLDTIKNDIFQKTIAPVVVDQLDLLKKQVLHELSQKLNSIDQMLIENITKSVKNETVTKVLSSTVVTTLQPSITQCYKDFFTTVVMPSLEKTAAHLFGQVDSTFKKGVEEYASKMKEQSDYFIHKQDDQSVQVQTMIDILKKTSIDLTASFEGVKEHLTECMTRGLTMQQALLEGSIAAVHSRAVTPAPHVLDIQAIQAQLLHMINKGDINGAFQQALSASDLNLVMFICEKVNPTTLFNQATCPLQQHVLLSLIQQMAADMNNHTELKQKYLEEALMNLDVNNPLTSEHLPKIFPELQRQLQTFINNNPTNRATRSMKMLLMASNAIYKAGPSVNHI